MASSTFRSATVEEYDEDPRDNGAHSVDSPHAESNVDLVPSTDCYPHGCEPLDLPQSVIHIQSARKYPPEAHKHPPVQGYDDVEPLLAQLPTAPTPPLNPRPRKSKVKTSSSSRRRDKDRPEYYGIRGTVTAVAPAAAPMNPGWTSNFRIARRPTTGWYASGSPPTGAGSVGPTADPPPRVRRLHDNSNFPPSDVPPANAFRNSGGTQARGHQPPSLNGWDTPETHTDGSESLHIKIGAPHYPPAQQQNPHGIVVLSQGHGSRPSDPSSQPNGSGMDGRYAESSPQPQPLQSPAQHNQHGPVVLSSNGNGSSNTSDEGFYPPGPRRMPLIDDERRLPPQPPASQKPHGHHVLSSNGSQSTNPPNEAHRQPDFQRMPQAGDEHRAPTAPIYRSAPQHDDSMGVHQGPASQNYGKQPVPPVHMATPRPRTSYGSARCHPSRDLVCITPSSHPDLQRLSLQDAPPEDQSIQHIPPHVRAGQFRSDDMSGASTSYPDATSYELLVDTLRQAPACQRKAYSARSGSICHTPHAQRGYPDGQYPPPQHRPVDKSPAAIVSRDWLQRTSKPPHPQQPSHNCTYSHGTTCRPPLSSGQVGYPLKARRYGPTKEVYRSKDNCHEPAEDFESNIHERGSWPTKHPGDTPTLSEGHPFLQMKDIALAAILKEFRAWKTSGTPGRRGPHGRRPPFACPFAKNDPIHYKDCFSDTLPSIPDVKEHVSRCHAIPIYCPRCTELFDDERSRDDHIRHAVCPSQKLSRPSGVTESQKRQLRNIPTYRPPQGQWASMFIIVLPCLQVPESPYVDENLHEDVFTYRDFLETRGTRVLSDVLTFRGAATWNLPSEERDLAAFRCLVLKEGIHDLVGQWARRGEGDPLRSPSSLASISAAGPQTPSMESFASSEGQQGREHALSDPVKSHHWDLRPSTREEGWAEFGNGLVRNDFSGGPEQKMPLHPVSRREWAPYDG